jgi:environmental stress-induced protein Ves
VRVHVLPAADRTSEPWRNGHGRTAVVAAGDGWRVSIAQLRDASPFSSFPGTRRQLMGLSPAAVTLNVNGRPQRCEPLQAYGFEGEDSVFAAEVDAPIEVLNLMWQRDRHRATLSAVAVDGSVGLRAAPAVLLLAIATSGPVATADGVRLGRLDGLMLTGGESVVVCGRGQLALARVERYPVRPSKAAPSSSASTSW